MRTSTPDHALKRVVSVAHPATADGSSPPPERNTAVRLAGSVLVAFLLVGGCSYTVQTVYEPLSVGARAPDFLLPSSRGDQISLHAFLDVGPAVLVFYRGHW